MKAALFIDREKIEYTDRDKPVPKDDEILAEVKYCGICGTDIALYEGNMPWIKKGFQKYPFIAGHEWSGKVVEIGPKVRNFKVGDRVTSDVSLSCGKCDFCREGKFNLCPNRSVTGVYKNRQGAFAEYITVPERHTYKFSKKVDYLGGAIIEPLATALYSIERKKLDYGDNTLITGGGFIGILASQLITINKSTTAILTGRTEEKLEKARQCGVNDIVNIKKKNLEKYLKEKGIYDKITFCIECSGNIKALKQCIELIQPSGHISLIGFYEENQEMVDFDDISTKDLEIHGILASPNCFRPSIDLLEKGLVIYRPLISKIFNLNELGKAIDFVLNKKNNCLKAMIKIN